MYPVAPIFAMMVLTALVTTFATGPLLTLADLLRKRQEERAAGAAWAEPATEGR